MNTQGYFQDGQFFYNDNYQPNDDDALEGNSENKI